MKDDSSGWEKSGRGLFHDTVSKFA